MNALCIGNSFSQNATIYLHQIAKCNNKNINAVNLYIGGCSLLRHYQNMLGDKKEYSLHFNGIDTGFFVTLKESLLSREWDYITLQQASKQSPYYETYQPYLNELAKYVRQCAPHAKICIHQTWAYEEESERLCAELGYAHRKDMFKDVEISYNQAAKDINADIIFKSGELIENLFDAGIKKLHKDTFHLNTTGCYALGLLWYNVIIGEQPNDQFLNFLTDVSKEDAEIIHSTLHQIF